MTDRTTKSALSPQGQRLLVLMQEMHFGRIERLVVRCGDPVFDPPPRLVREIRLGGTDGSRPEIRSQDFTLKSQVVDLFAQLRRLGNGTVESLEIQHGLPFRMKLEEEIQA